MECSICSEKFSKDILRMSCGHIFCQTCFVTSFEVNSFYPVECFSCKSILNDMDCMKMFRGDCRKRWEKCRKDWMDIFDKNLYKCLNPKCDGEMRNFEKNKIRSFICQKCKLKTCLKCKATHLRGEKCKTWRNNHKDFNEEKRNNRKEIEKKIKEKNAMYCVTCGLYIERDQGCYGMKCNRCKTELCFITQKRRWGPQGSGDTSDGCGCSLTKKCHPNCTSCDIHNEGYYDIDYDSDDDDYYNNDFYDYSDSDDDYDYYW